MAKAKKGRKAKRGARKVAPLAVGGRRGSAGRSQEELGRIEQDLVAAIDDAISALETLKRRVEELGAERSRVAPEALDAPMIPTNIRTD